MTTENAANRIDYMVQIWREDTHCIAHAMPLDVMSSGNSPDDARRSLDEAVHLFLLTAQDHGTLSDVLHECGYAENNGSWRAPDWIGVENHSSPMSV